MSTARVLEAVMKILDIAAAYIRSSQQMIAENVKDEWRDEALQAQGKLAFVIVQINEVQELIKKMMKEAKKDERARKAT
ncbi:MAG: hypothetical protein QXG57_06165 [Thermofilaceae archaeon]